MNTTCVCFGYKVLSENNSGGRTLFYINLQGVALFEEFVGNEPAVLQLTGVTDVFNFATISVTQNGQGATAWKGEAYAGK